MPAYAKVRCLFTGKTWEREFNPLSEYYMGSTNHKIKEINDFIDTRWNDEHETDLELVAFWQTKDGSSKRINQVDLQL